MAGERSDSFRDWFWRPPRPHGQTIRDRSVSNLELLYDLVYVAVIGQAAHDLAVGVSVRDVVEFAIVFAMIWVAWVNGSLYLELHGRQDGRTRAVVFLQIGVLALLAVFTGTAGGSGGAGYALVYALFLAVLTWLWDSVRRQDEPEYRAVAAAYVTGMVISIVAILASALLPDDARLALWAVYVLAWIVGMGLLGSRSTTFPRSMAPTDSMVERFDLLTIIVLGEVVIGVVDGLSHAEHDAITIVTGMLALVVGFGFWWMYFDVVGRRFPRPAGGAIAGWMIAHLPVTLAITGAGAAMVGLIEHAHDPTTPQATAWLLAGSVALGLFGIIAVSATLADAHRLASVYRPLSLAMAGGALASLVAGALAPAPWILALALVAILAAVWLLAVGRFLREHAWGREPETAAD